MFGVIPLSCSVGREANSRIEHPIVILFNRRYGMSDTMSLRHCWGEYIGDDEARRHSLVVSHLLTGAVRALRGAGRGT